MLKDCIVLPLSDKDTLIVEKNVPSVHSGINIFYFKINYILLEFDNTSNMGAVN